MSDRILLNGRQRISPSPGRTTKVAYQPLPRSDPDGRSNCTALDLKQLKANKAPGQSNKFAKMNLMFRKNFREGGGGGKTSTGKLASKASRSQGKRSRDLGGFQNPDDIHYRTHLFFSPTRGQGGMDNEERCGPLLSGVGAYSLTSDDAPQPLVDRRPSISLLKWTASKRNEPPTPTIAAKVTFGGSARSEPISLATLDRDCFIIPVHSLDRFLPAGIPLPPPTAEGVTSNSPLSVLEVTDPKLCILVHLMSPLEPIDPILESPLAHPLLKQRAVAAELLNEVQQSNTASGGMLLVNMERNADFPFISYYVINTTQTDPSHFYSNLRNSSLSKFEPKNLRYTAAHTLDLYCEVASICRPPLNMAPNELGNLKKTQTPSTAYIISVYKVFEGDDGERFEKNWLYWTGARMIYRYLPRSAGLKRIALHKSISQKGDKMYLLICECSDILKNITDAAVLIPALRARLCGYTGLYKPIQAF